MTETRNKVSFHALGANCGFGILRKACNQRKTSKRLVLHTWGGKLRHVDRLIEAVRTKGPKAVRAGDPAPSAVR
jgi:hypothetical protein